MSAPGAPAGDPNKPDYLDKGLDAGLKKYGGAKFQDSNKNRGTTEKIGDAIRKFLEKVTGKKAPAKVSN